MLTHFTLLVQFYILHFIISPSTFTISKRKQPRRKGEISYLIFWVLKRLAPFGAKILSLLINPRHLAPKYLEHFIGSAPPLFILDPLLWIGSAYSFVYINSCLWLNKLLTNLTSSRQHHLQYTGGLAETQGLLLPSVIVTLFKTRYSSYRHNQFFSEFFKRLLFLSEQSF